MALCVCVCVCVYIYIYIYVRVCVRVFVCVCIYIYIYIVPGGTAGQSEGRVEETIFTDESGQVHIRPCGRKGSTKDLGLTERSR